MSVSPASILYDEAGNPVAVLNDSGVYRLRVDAKLASGHGLATEATLLGVKADTARLNVDLSTRASAAAQTDGSQKTQVVNGANTLAIDGSGRAAIQNQPNMDVALSTRLAEATFTARFGEVSATPTANTLLGRLKEIYDAIVARWNTLGQKTMANSAPVVIASDQSPVTVRGPNADGAAPTESPILIAGFDGTNVRRLRTDQSGRLLTRQFDEPTFAILANDIALANNKSMLSILNTGTAVICVREVWVINTRIAAVTGVAGDFQIRRITGHSAGTDLSTTPGFLPHDTADTVPTGLTARTGATVAGEAAGPLHRRVWSTDEWGPGTLDNEGYDHGVQNALPFYRSEHPKKPITLRTNQGISIRFNTNSTAGTFDIVAVLSEGVL